MIEFNFKNMLEKRNMSRYRFEFLSNFDTRRTNQFYFGTAKNIKVSELETICNILDCQTSDILKYKPGKAKKITSRNEGA